MKRSELMTIGMRAVREAGHMVADNAGAIAQVDTKDDRSLVTDLDYRADRMLRRTIRAHCPGHAILTEESGWEGADAEYQWIIDPIDGTHNFIRGIPLYGVQLAILYRGAFVASVIYLPAVDKMFAAEQGSGAFVNDLPIHVSSRNALSACSLSYDSGLKRSTERKLSVLAALARQVFNIRMFGASSALLTALAEGTVDVAVEFDDKPWDFAPGVCLIAEAGGMMTGHDGQAISLETHGYVASNGAVHRETLEAVAAER